MKKIKRLATLFDDAGMVINHFITNTYILTIELNMKSSEDKKYDEMLDQKSDSQKAASVKSHSISSNLANYDEKVKPR